MPSLEDAFLADIIAHPEDDAPRLIYADWLQEQGRETRAELIRVQIELASRRHAGGPTHCGRSRWLRNRERELLSDWEAADVPWGPAGPLFFAPAAWTHRRGFLFSISLDTEDWLRFGPALVRLVPLEEMSLTDRCAFDSTVGASLLAPVRYLWFRRRDRWDGLPWGEPGDEPAAWDVPPPWWPYLPDCGPGTAGHPTREAADAALSAAALAWARAEAALSVGSDR